MSLRYFHCIMPRTSLLFISLTLCVYNCWADDVLGCGGYIKSEVEINFPQIHIKLLTEQRNVKYETECAPHNGYYFIPIYNYGNYILKVIAPEAWSFEPEEISLKIDGENDRCSKGEDINFIFKGFAIIGRVITSGSAVGPSGVAITLTKNGKEILRTTSLVNGDYSFSPIAVGNYEIEAFHQSWKFINSKVSLTVLNKTGNAGSSLVIAGYSLLGRFESNDPKLCQIAKIILHSAKDISSQEIGCQNDQLKEYISKEKYSFLCHSALNANCDFSFSTLPLGKYILVPWAKFNDTEYDIIPTSLDVEILHDDLIIQNPFKIVGQDFKGQVLSSKEGSRDPLSGATVAIGDNLTVETDENGFFIFPKLKYGLYRVKILADSYEFEDLYFDLQHGSSSVSFFPVKYLVCFSVSVESASGFNIPWTISIVGQNEELKIHTDSSSRACTFLRVGNYTASIVLAPHDKEAGIRFGPPEHKFVVDSKPLENLTFAQYLAEIHGTLFCIESCRSLTITLKPPKGSYGSSKSTTSVQEKFVFKEVVPGEYLLTVDKEEWCWKNQTIHISVNKKKINVKFVQTGFRLSLISSHNTTLSYVTNRGHKGRLNISEGTSRECVSDFGQYIFSPNECHKYGSALTWNTSSPQLLSLIASHHKVSGSLISNEPGPFHVTIKSNRRPDDVIGPLVLSEFERHTYVFEAWLESGESGTLIPSSSSNLFHYLPQEFIVEDISNCLLSAVRFVAERALFFKGFVKPPIKGVSIIVVSEDIRLEYSTNSDGIFIAGPLNKSLNYVVYAEKLGFVLSPSYREINTTSTQNSSEMVKMNFEAHKLAEIVISVVNERGVPLEGVLVSTSGGDNYRQNSLTGGDGSFVFRSLTPSEYFIKPMMKEYIFEPSSKMVKVDSGATVSVQIKGIRIAYSIWGQTLSLSGEIEGEVVIETIGVGPKCEGLQEEGASDRQGNFRIRGLVPNCDYLLKLKRGSGVNEHVERALPSERRINVESEDLRDVQVIVIRPFLQMDVSVFVETEPQFLPSLSAELYRDDAPGYPIHVVQFGNHPFAMLPPMLIDHKVYTVSLSSTLPSRSYVYSTPSKTFVANASFVRHRFTFTASLRSVDAETSRGTVIFLVVFTILMILVLNKDKVLPIVMRLVEEYRASILGKSGKISPSRGSLDGYNSKKKIKSKKI